MPGQMENKYTWLGSESEVDFDNLGILVAIDSHSYAANKKCVCLKQGPLYLRRNVTLNKVLCETDHYILCDQWKGKVVKNGLLQTACFCI